MRLMLWTVGMRGDPQGEPRAGAGLAPELYVPAVVGGNVQHRLSQQCHRPHRSLQLVADIGDETPRSPPGELHPIHPTCPHPDAPRRRHPVRGQKDQSAPHPASCSVTPHRRPRQGRLTDPAIEQTISPLARTASPVPACTSSSSRGTREREISNSSCATAPTSPAAPSPWIQGPKIRRRTGSPRQSNAGTDRLLHRTPRLVNPELRICGFFPRI